MGFLDKLKQMFGGRKAKDKQGNDKGADAVGDRIPGQHADKVDDVADNPKDAVDKLD